MPVIYRITNLINGKLYIGSAINAEQRRRRHFKDLNKQIHHSHLLQKAFNKYSIEAFRFEIIETVADKNDLIVREQYWIF